LQSLDELLMSMQLKDEAIQKEETQ
jgi:hypothetical protein